MNEGIELAMKHQFLYIGINASNVNYLPKLRLLRDVTNDPILISTTTYTMEEQGEAIANGADLFGQISDNPESNIKSVMALINRLNERAMQRKNTDGVLIDGDVIVSTNHNIAFIKDDIIQLTDTEVKIMRFMMLNRGKTVKHKEMYYEIYKGEYFKETSSDILYSTMKRLRKKIKKVTPHNYIETIWDVGYRITTDIDTK